MYECCGTWCGFTKCYMDYTISSDKSNWLYSSNWSNSSTWYVLWVFVSDGVEHVLLGSIGRSLIFLLPNESEYVTTLQDKYKMR